MEKTRRKVELLRDEALERIRDVQRRKKSRKPKIFDRRLEREIRRRMKGV